MQSFQFGQQLVGGKDRSMAAGPRVGGVVALVLVQE